MGALGPVTAATGAGPATAATLAGPGLLGGRSLAAIRADFPILARRIGGAGGRSHLLAYLDNAATTQKPLAVLQAIRRYYEHSNANVHRSLHTLGEEATAAYEQARRRVAGFLNASAAEIIFTRGATEAINLVASSYTRTLAPGSEILLTEMEHHSNLVPWQLAARDRGLTLRFLPVGPEGTLELEALEKTSGPRLALIAVSLVSNVLGTINDLPRIVAFARERGVPVLVDAAQAVGHLPVDVRALGCDFLAFSGHKMYAPMGIGVLYGRQQLLEGMEPYMGGGEMIRTVSLESSTWNELPYKFEAGTPNVEGAVGLEAAIDYLEALGREAVRDYEGELTRYALRRLEEVPGLTLYGPREAALRTGVFSFQLAGVHPHDVAQWLDAEGVALRAGHHCAQPLHARLGVNATARASLGLYNLPDEIDRLARGLGRVREVMGRGNTID
jgi:cysteine desulfurase/selenocysteine lyase